MSTDVAAEIFLDTDAMSDDEEGENELEESQDHQHLKQQQQQVATTKKSSRRRLYALRSSTDLWIRIEEDNEEAGNDSSSSKVQLLRLFVSEQTGDWKVERRNLEDDPTLAIEAMPTTTTSTTTTTSSSKSMKKMKKDKSKRFDSTGKNKKKLHLRREDEDQDDRIEQHRQQWVPIEGLYGMYRVPTGYLWVLITQSEPVYTAPQSSKSTSSLLQWQIRRVSNLHSFPTRPLPI